MPDYQDRRPPEGINVSAEHPLRVFVKLSVAALVLVVVLVVLVQTLGGVAARWVPFEAERRVVQRLDIDFGDAGDDDPMQRYLNELAGRLLPLMPDVESGMAVTVHYDSDATFNAFATLGGNLLFYRGLLSALPNENALAMVMAHEIAHVLHRDPAAGLGGGVASALLLAGITGNAGTGAAAGVLSRAGVVTGMQFTRRMELAADHAAAAAVAGLYGHLNGAAMLFEVIGEARGGEDGAPPGWLERFATTHPIDTDRIAAIAERARELGVPLDGPTTPLPADYARWLER